MNERIVLNFLREDYQAESVDFHRLQIDLDVWLNDKVSPNQDWFRVTLEPVSLDGHDAYRFSIYSISVDLHLHPLYSTVLAFAEGFFCGKGFTHYTVETYLQEVNHARKNIRRRSKTYSGGGESPPDLV